MHTSVAPTPQIRRLGRAITGVSLAAIVFATLLPASDPVVGSHLCLICGSLGGVDAVLNVLLFVPLGIGLAVVGARAMLALPAMCAASVLIEIAQLTFVPGRDASIGDVVTNSLGGGLGFALARYATSWLRPSPRFAVLLSVGWCVVWLTIQTASNFGFAPSFPKSSYYGQIARQLGDFELFPGRVVRASIGDVKIADALLDDSQQVQRLLLGGATVGATVIPAGSTYGTAPIVRVADSEQREIALLAQDGSEFLFEVRTGAAVLRFHPPLFALPGVFRADSGGRSEPADTLRLGGSYVANSVRMNAHIGSASNERHIPISGSLGWTMVLPFQWFIEGTLAERVLGWIWTASLLIPLGYWATRVTYPFQMQRLRWRPAVIAVAVLTVLTTGLVLVPRGFGLSAGRLFDWLAALSGVTTGCALAARGARPTAATRSGRA